MSDGCDVPPWAEPLTTPSLLVSSEVEALAPTVPEVDDLNAELELRFGFSLDVFVELSELELFLSVESVELEVD